MGPVFVNIQKIVKDIYAASQNTKEKKSYQDIQIVLGVSKREREEQRQKYKEVLYILMYAKELDYFSQI